MAWGWLGRRHLGTGADRTTFRTLHTASLATPALRAGLTAASAEKAVRHLRSLLGAPAIALTDTTDLLAWDGGFSHHGDQTGPLARQAVAAAPPPSGSARPSPARTRPAGCAR